MATAAQAVSGIDISAADAMDVHSDSGFDFGDGDIDLDLEPAPSAYHHDGDEDVSIQDAATDGGLELQTYSADQDDFMVDDDDLIEPDNIEYGNEEVAALDEYPMSDSATTQAQTLPPADEDLIDYSDDEEEQQPQDDRGTEYNEGIDAQDEVSVASQVLLEEDLQPPASIDDNHDEERNEHSEHQDTTGEDTAALESGHHESPNSHRESQSKADYEQFTHQDNDDGGILLQKPELSGGEAEDDHNNDHIVTQDDLDNTENTAVPVLQDNEPSELRPVTVNYGGNDLWLFKQYDTDNSGDWLLEDISLASSGMSDLFQACRSALGDDVSNETEIGFRFDHLHNMELYEDNTACVAVSLDRLVDLYHTLHAQDGDSEPESFYVSLQFRPRFATLLADVAKYAEQGSGFSGLSTAIAAGETHFTKLFSGASTEHEFAGWESEEQGEHDVKEEEHDTREEEHDTREEEHDTREEEHDTRKEEHDTREEEHDAREEEHDAGEEEHDAGEEEHDAGEEEHDAGEEEHGAGEEDPTAMQPADDVVQQEENHTEPEDRGSLEAHEDSEQEQHRDDDREHHDDSVAVENDPQEEHQGEQDFPDDDAPASQDSANTDSPQEDINVSVGQEEVIGGQGSGSVTELQKREEEDRIDYSDDEGSGDVEEAGHSSAKQQSPPSSTVQGDEPTVIEDDGYPAESPQPSGDDNEEHDAFSLDAEDQGDSASIHQEQDGNTYGQDHYPEYDQTYDQEDTFQDFQENGTEEFSIQPEFEGDADQNFTGYEHQTLDQLDDGVENNEEEIDDPNTVTNDFTGIEDFLDFSNASEWATNDETFSTLPEDAALAHDGVAAHDDEEDGVVEQSAARASPTANPVAISLIDSKNFAPQRQKRSIDEIGNEADDAIDSTDPKRPRV